MVNVTASMISGVFLVVLCLDVMAEGLPKTGSISWHTGWRNTGEVMEVAKGYVEGHGSVIGTSFNDKGSGPLHGGPAECVYTFLSVNGVGPSKGYCAFGDADGDRIITDWTGEGSSGTNVIVAGTGKFAGITGSGPFTRSGPTGTHGGWVTFQRLDYKLP